jgi:hypothetical protein
MVNQSDYDRLYRKPGIPIEEEAEVTGGDDAPLKLKVIKRTPEERHARVMQLLEERIKVVGHDSQGNEIIRRVGGADYKGNDVWINAMRRVGRIKR